jgi:exodeoxyribonuclease V alpha subunit
MARREGPDAPGDTPLAVVEGTLERIVFANEETAWSVVRLAVPGRGEVTAVGNLLGVQPGESLRLSGAWVTDPRYGEQFRVDGYVTLRPSTLLGIERYLGSGLVPGVGKAIAARLVEHFGASTLDVLDGEPARLTEVEGIGPVRARAFEQAWREQRRIREVMVFLQGHGVSTAYAVKIYKQYGDRAVAVVRDNPYRLAEDVFGIGFLTADRIAQSLGIPPDSPRRAEAGLLHILAEMAASGHVYAPRRRLVEEGAKLLAVEPGVAEAALAALVAARRVVAEEGGHLSVDGRDDAVFLDDLHAAESGVAARLRAVLAAPARPIDIDPERAIAWFEQSQGLVLAPAQRQALRRAFSAKVLVITGGPGTGKTTIVNGVIRVLERKGRRIVLAAPTGRAAKRLNEATGREARTIHRLLEYSPRRGTFERDRSRPLEADLVIVDEMSMVDVVLARSLLEAVPDPAQMVLLGDVDQLPSVGPGAVLADLIRSGATEVVTLTEIFRQSEASRIVLNAHRVNDGEMPLLGDGGDGGRSDFYLVERAEPEQVLATVKELVGRRIPRQFDLDPVADIQVLTPMHRGSLGAQSLNAELQALLNPGGEAIARGARLFRAGDKVMQLRNNYDLEVFNGDIGQLVEVDPDQRRVRVRFEERVVTYDQAQLDELVLAYACTIHKSQGAEYPAVVIPLHSQHWAMLQRNLLYTAITRGKRLVVVVGSRKALAMAVRNHRVEERFTRLAARLG